MQVEVTGPWRRPSPRSALAVFAAAVALISPAAAAWACNPQAYLLLDQSSYASGAPVTVKGGFFPANRQVTLSVEPGDIVATVTTLRDGSFSTAFPAPISAGTYTLSAITYEPDGSVTNGLPARASFVVEGTPSTTRPPAPSPPGGARRDGSTSLLLVLAGCATRTGQLALTSGDDVETGTARADLIFARDGDDVIDALGGDDCVDLGAGNDRGRGRLGDDLLVGGPGGDNLWGSAGRDRLRADGGGDRVVGGPGEDSLFGGAGGDRLLGGPAADAVWGQAGDDLLSGAGGRDRISGGAGGDRIGGGRGRDRISCGSGRDKVVADSSDRVRADCEQVRRRR